jgi:hypothetical protein
MIAPHRTGDDFVVFRCRDPDARPLEVDWE